MTSDITDHEDPHPTQPTVLAYHALPYPFGDQSALSMYMWCVEQVLQHPETPLTDKTRAFIKDLFGDILAAGSEVQKPRIEVVK